MTANNDYITYTTTGNDNDSFTTFYNGFTNYKQPIIKLVEIKLTQKEMKLSNLSGKLCDDCLTHLIEVTCKDLPEHIAYFVVVISTCSDCYAKLVEDKLVPQTITYVSEMKANQKVDPLWTNQKLLNQIDQ